MKTTKPKMVTDKSSDQRHILHLGVPTHFRPSNENISACGIEHPQYAAYDGRDVNCLLCRKTRTWKTYMGKSGL